MDKAIRDLYFYILKKNARVTHFIEEKNYYEVHLEWDMGHVLNTWGPDQPERIQTKLIAIIKP